MKITPELIAAAVQHLPEGHVEGDIILNIDDYEWRRFVATVGLPVHFAADQRDTVLPARARVTIEILGKDDQVEKKHGFLVDDMVTPQQAGEMVTRTIELANRQG